MDDAVLVGLEHVGRHVEGGRLRHGGRVETAVAGRHAPLGEDGRHHRQVVLVAHEVVCRRVTRLVQRVQDPRVVWPKAQLVDVVAEVEGRVVEMCLQPDLHVAVAAGGDVEVSLHLVALKGAIDAAGVDGHLAADAGRGRELLTLVLTQVAEDVSDVRVLLFGLPARPVRRVQVLVDASLILLLPRQ